MLQRLAPRLLALLLGAALAPGLLAAPPVSDATVKAAFVYNFAKFVDWPESSFPTSQDPIRLCLYGSADPFLAALEHIDGKATHNRSIRVLKAAQLADLRGCHILAVAESERRQLQEPLHAAQDMGILTVGEADGFVDAGGIIGLVVEEERVQFEVNLEAARRANVKLNPQLLKLARKVRR